MKILTIPAGLILAAAFILGVIVLLGLVSLVGATFFWVSAGIEISKDIERWLRSRAR